MAIDIIGFNRMRRQQADQVKKKLSGKSSKKKSSKKGEGYV